MKPEGTTTATGQSRGAVGGSSSSPGLLPFSARRRSRYRWRLHWGRPLPWPTRVELLATLALWLGGAWGWEHWQGRELPLPPTATGTEPPAQVVAATARAALLLTAERPDAEGLFDYRQDRLEVRVPVALSQTPRLGSRPDLSRARGQDPSGLRFELSRVFDPRARSTDAADLAHDQAANVCRIANATLLDATDETLLLPGAEGAAAALHTVVHAQLVGGKGLTLEGLTLDDPAGPVAWMLWAVYPSADRRAAALVHASFGSARLRALSTGGADGADR